jgi:hypothetical protein
MATKVKKVSAQVPSPPPKLIEAIKERKCALFVGAGLSQGAGLPGWRNLLEQVILRASGSKEEGNKIVRSRKGQLRKLLEFPHQYLNLAQELSDLLTPTDFRKILVEIIKEKDVKPSIAHMELTKIPFSLVITTNYDKLLEKAYSISRGGDPPTVYTHQDPEDFPRDFYKGDFFILKAHGTIDKQTGLIITHRDYRQIVRGSFGYRLLLAAVFATRTVFFVGASLNDPELRLLLDEVNDAFQGRGPENYALVPSPEVTDVDVNRWSRDYNVKCLRYQPTKGHPEVVEFLKKIQAAL